MPILMGTVFIFVIAVLGIYWIYREKEGGLLKEAHSDLRRAQEEAACKRISRRAEQIRNYN